MSHLGQQMEESFNSGNKGMKEDPAKATNEGKLHKGQQRKGSFTGKTKEEASPGKTETIESFTRGNKVREVTRGN